MLDVNASSLEKIKKPVKWKNGLNEKAGVVVYCWCWALVCFVSSFRGRVKRDSYLEKVVSE